MRSYACSGLAVLLLLGGCGAIGPGNADVGVTSLALAPDDPACRVYTAFAYVDNATIPLAGRACRQPDGSWKVTEGRAGGPMHEYGFTPAPGAGGQPWTGNTPPIGISLGRPVTLKNGRMPGSPGNQR